jgi:hypothetical protein
MLCGLCSAGCAGCSVGYRIVVGIVLVINDWQSTVHSAAERIVVLE